MDVQQLISEIVKAGGAPGGAIAVSAAGERSIGTAGFTQSSGDVPLAEGARFQLGCITKVLTSIVALESAASGSLDLDAPIGTYLEELRDVPAGTIIRARHLLSHTSGYQGVNIADVGVRYCSGWAGFLTQLRRGPQLFQPGTVFNYEHTEYVLLGEILRRIRGKSIGESYEEVIFEPLGIRCGKIGADPNDASYVAEHSFDAPSRQYRVLRSGPHCAFWDASLSDLTMSLPDLLTLGDAIGGWSSRSVLRPETVAQLRQAHVGLPMSLGGSQHEHVPLSFGLGLAQYAPHTFGHNGSARGQTCGLRVIPEARLTLVVALNAWRPYIRDMLLDKVAAAFWPHASPASTINPSGWDLGSWTGKYVGAAGTSVEATGGETELHCVLCAGKATPPLRIVASRAADGTVQIASSATHMTLGFFRDPTAESVPGLLLGLNAYRRESTLAHQ